MACAKRANERSGVLKVVALPKGKVDSLLTVTGLRRVIEAFGDEEAALASF